MKRILLGLLMLILASCGNANSTDSQFKWDFTKQRKFVYSFSQIVKGENRMSKDRPADKTYMTGNGFLNVSVKESNLADVSLTDLNMNMIMFDESGAAKDTLSQKAPPVVVPDMHSNGRFMNSNNDILFDMIFPLPTKNIEEGGSDKILMEMPFNANGSPLLVKGQNTLTFVGYEAVEGKSYAVLEGVIDISELDVPKELDGEYLSTTKGKARYYFDPENGYYIGADIQMNMEVMMDFKVSPKDDFGRFVEMKSDNLYKIRLEKIEE